jgi:hypothetical protein
LTIKPETSLDVHEIIEGQETLKTFNVSNKNKNDIEMPEANQTAETTKAINNI